MVCSVSCGYNWSNLCMLRSPINQLHPHALQDTHSTRQPLYIQAFQLWASESQTHQNSEDTFLGGRIDSNISIADYYIT